MFSLSKIFSGWHSFVSYQETYICLLFLLSQNLEYHSIPSGRINWCLITLDRIDYILPSVYSGYAGMITCDLDYMCALCMWNYWDSFSLFLMNFDRKYMFSSLYPPIYVFFVAVKLLYHSFYSFLLVFGSDDKWIYFVILFIQTK